MTRRILLRVAFASVLIALGAAAANAHAFLDRAEPGVGSTLAAAPAQVRIWFTEALEPAFSTIAVTDARGRDVGQGNARVDAANPMLLEVGLAALAPGTYTVKWRVISIDTHPTEGDFTFTVKP
jgi:copper resistance protein C